MSTEDLGREYTPESCVGMETAFPSPWKRNLREREREREGAEMKWHNLNRNTLERCQHSGSYHTLYTYKIEELDTT